MTKEQLKNAYDFFDYNIKEGVYDETILVGLSPEAVYKLYVREDARADSYDIEPQDEDLAEYLHDNMEDARVTGN